MRQSGRTTLFVLVCIAVLCASYGVGLGVRNLRMSGFKINISMGHDTKKSTDTSESESKPEPKAGHRAMAAVAEPAQKEKSAAKPTKEPAEAPTAPAERADLRAKNEQSPDLSAAEQPTTTAQGRRGGAGRRRGQGRNRSAYQQLSEEDRNSMREKMEALRAKAADMSEEEMSQARREILAEYGINPPADGARGPGGRQ